MDALALDQMLPEYQQKRQDAADEIMSPRRNHSPSPVPSSEELYEAEVGSADTLPVADDEPDLSPLAVEQEADPNTAGAVFNQGRGSKSSSSSSGSFRDNYSQSASFYTPSSMSPSISYDRDDEAQKLVAVFGRQFDRPDEIASHFQKLVLNMVGRDKPGIKFVPFTLKRTSLMKGNYSSEELYRHDLVCMCYNASEARILLTGTDGFYTSLLRYTEAILGSNKVVFLITNYNRYKQVLDNQLVSPELKSRLRLQEPLRPYLDGDQVLSWVGEPSEGHLAKLMELAESEKNPQGLLHQSCTII